MVKGHFFPLCIEIMHHRSGLISTCLGQNIAYCVMHFVKTNNIFKLAAGNRLVAKAGNLAHQGLCFPKQQAAQQIPAQMIVCPEGTTKFFNRRQCDWELTVLVRWIGEHSTSSSITYSMRL